MCTRGTFIFQDELYGFVFKAPLSLYVFFFTVTYHGRRDADYTVIIGSRATGTASCLVSLFMFFY